MSAPLRPNPGAQTKFLTTSADVAFYGGAKGGGKTRGLLMEALRHINNPGWCPVIFRRTYSEIFQAGGLWSESLKFYRRAGGVPKYGDSEWRFPSGAAIQFRHMQHEEDKETWEGAQVPLLGFDEIVSFTETQFWYLLTRNRSTCGVRPYARGTCNPDSGSWVAKLIDWWIDQDTGYPIADRSGVVRWMIRNDEQLVWADSWAELHERFPTIIAPPGRMPDGVNEKRIKPLSFTFIPAKLDDNPPLEKADPEYRTKLMMMPHVERERWLHGNWKITPVAGLKFPRDKWNIKHDVPPPGLRLVRFWDKAYTADGTGARTAGVLMGELVNHRDTGMPRFWVVNAVCGRWGDAEREAMIKNTAEMDRRTYGHVTTGIEQEGAAGKFSANWTINALAGFDVFAKPARGEKALRWTPLASQQQVGNVAIVKGAWDWSGYMAELDALAGDDKLDKGKLRDLADASAGAFEFLTGGGGIIQGELLASGDPEHLEEESKPFSEEEIDGMSPEWKDLIQETTAAAKERTRRGGGWGRRWDD